VSEEQMAGEELIGEVTHYFDHVGAAVLDLNTQLQVGETIHIKGYTTDLVQQVESMQIDHADVQQAGPGEDVAILVSDRVREGDEVYRVQ